MLSSPAVPEGDVSVGGLDALEPLFKSRVRNTKSGLSIPKKPVKRTEGQMIGLGLSYMYSQTRSD